MRATEELPPLTRRQVADVRPYYRIQITQPHEVPPSDERHKQFGKDYQSHQNGHRQAVFLKDGSVETPSKPKRDKRNARGVINGIPKLFTDDKYSRPRAIATAVIFWILTISAPLIQYFTGWLPDPDELWPMNAVNYNYSYTTTLAIYLFCGMIIPGIALFAIAYAPVIFDYNDEAAIVTAAIPILAAIIHIVVIVAAIINGVLPDFISSILCLLAFGIILLDDRNIGDIAYR